MAQGFLPRQVSHAFLSFDAPSGIEVKPGCNAEARGTRLVQPTPSSWRRTHSLQLLQESQQNVPNGMAPSASLQHLPKELYYRPGELLHLQGSSSRESDSHASGGLNAHVPLQWISQKPHRKEACSASVPLSMQYLKEGTDTM